MKVRKIHVRPGYLVADQRVWQASPGVTYQIVDEQPTAISLIDLSASNTDNVQQDTAQQVTTQQDTNTQDTVKQDSDKQDKEKQDRDKHEALLLKEMDEINHWARLGCQLYFGWYAVQFTANGFATGWLFTRAGGVPPFANSVFLALIGTNLLGLIGTLLSLKNLLAYDLRLKDVLGRLTLHHGSESQSFPPLSPMPRQQINMVFGLCAVILFMAMAFWAVMLVQYAR